MLRSEDIDVLDPKNKNVNFISQDESAMV